MHRAPPSLQPREGVSTSVPRASFPSHQGHWPSVHHMGPSLGPRAPTPDDHGQAAWDRLDLDRQVRGSIDPRIAQLADRNGPWLSPMEEDVGSYRFPGLAPQAPKREPSSSDGSIKTEVIKR